MDIRELSQRLAGEAEAVASYLLPNGKRVSSEWCTGDLDGNPGKSLRVHLTGSKAGVWADFSADGLKGDLVDLWAHVRGTSIADVLPEIKQYLGIFEPTWESRRAEVYERPRRPDATKPKGKVLEYLTKERGLSVEAIAAYQVAAGKNDDAIYFPSKRGGELITWKALALDRSDGKKKTWTAKNTEKCLFGWQAIPKSTREVTICEGEIDAMSLWQYGFPALSVPYGANNHQWLEGEYHHLDRFAEIYLVFDLDDAGEKGVNELSERIGRHRCRIVVLPHKDANECLQKGVSREVIAGMFQSSEPTDPEELKKPKDFEKAALRLVKDGATVRDGAMLPWRRVSDQIRLAPGELTIWSGTNGHGKSQVLGQVTLSLVKQDERVCIASLEIRPEVVLARMLRQVTASRNPAENYGRAGIAWMHNNLWLFNVVGTAKSTRLLEVFAYARKRHGIRHFVIDSLMKCGFAEDDHRGLKLFVEALCDFKNEHNCHVHLVAHPRKAMDESQVPGKLDVKGTGAIVDLADNIFTVWRNKPKEIKVEKLNGETIPGELADKPDCVIRCHKQRNGEWEGGIALWFDKESLQFLEGKNHEARPYFHYDERAL